MPFGFVIMRVGFCLWVVGWPLDKVKMEWETMRRKKKLFGDQIGSSIKFVIKNNHGTWVHQIYKTTRRITFEIYNVWTDHKRVSKKSRKEAWEHTWKLQNK